MPGLSQIWNCGIGKPSPGVSFSNIDRLYGSWSNWRRSDLRHFQSVRERALSEVSALAWHAVVIGISMSLLFILTLGLFPQEIFQGMGGTGEVLTGAVSYAQIAFGGSTVTWMLYILAAVFRGVGIHLHQPECSLLVAVVKFLSGALTLGWGLSLGWE